MKIKFKSKLLGVLLVLVMVLVMVLALVPVSALTAFAAGQDEVVTHDIDQIRELLRQDGDVRIKLDADAEKNLTAYSDFENTKWDSQYVWTKLGSGNKTIDLNGHRLYVYDQSARSLGSLDWMDFRYIQGALLTEIPNGASLTVNDSNGGGKIWMDAEMPDKSEMEGPGLLMERNIFAVTGGNLTINGGEIHAGRSKEIYAQNAPKYDKDYELIIDYTIAGIDFYEHLYGYATWFLSGTAITAESGNVTINGGNIWGRGWDNWSMITRVPGAPNGADDYRTRCAALRVLGTATAHITSGSFYGRSDADAVQVSNPNNLTVDAGSFDVGTNSLLVVPGVDSGGTADNVNDIFFHDSVFEVHEGSVGSFGIPAESLDDGSDAFISADEKTMTIAPIGSQTLPYKTVGDIGLYMNSPLAYQSPVDNANDIYGVPSDCEVESITWYENGHILENASSTYFKEGDSYYVKIALAADEYAKFNYNLTNATINGKNAEIYRKDDRHIVLTVHFGECVAAIEDAAFYAEEPLAGNYPSKWIDSNENNPYYAVGGYSNYGEYRTWYVSDDGVSGWTEMDSETPFEAGKYYRLTFEIHASEGQEFAVDASGVSVMPDITATVNGMPATVQKVYEQDPTQHIAVAIDFGKCPAVIQFVELTVTAPKEGNTLSYTVGCDSDAYYAIGSNSNYTDYRQWLESDTGYDGWRVMTPGETFKAGKYYKFITDIHTKNGYVFSTYDDGISIQPNVGAYVNDNGAKVTKGYEQDPSNYITVEYFFGICYDTVVEKIDVENVVSPVAGKTPTYTVSIRGNGYLLEGTTSGNWMVNGIVWLRDGDNYTGSIMDKTDTFLPGHTYTVMIDFVPAMGYSFLFDHGNSIYAAASINGNTAQINLETCSANQYTIWYTFTCGQKQIDTITITDLDTPVGGNTPDTTVTSGEPNFYTVESVTWFDIENGSVGATFEAGVPYYAKVVIASVKSSGTDIVKFADAESLKVSINGDSAVVMDGNVAVENNKVTIYVRFRKPASAPIVVPYMFTTQPAGNTVKVDENVNVNWQITFNATKTEIQQWNGSAWVVFNDTVQTLNGAGQYLFTSDTAKSIRLRIVAYIGSDAVATSNEFVIVWEESTEYIYVYTPGEGNGSNDFDYVTEGTQITLYTPEYMGYSPIDGFTFDYWSIRVGTAQSAEVAQKQPGDQITIDDNTYIIAIWKEAPLTEYMYLYSPGEANGSNDFDYVTNGTQITLYTPEFLDFLPIEGFEFDYWSIRVGSAMGTEMAQKQPGDTIIINDNTYIIAIWKAIPHTCVGVAESGQSATCTVDGWKDYYRCECGKYYEDANCQIPINDLEAWKVGAGKITAAHSGTPEWIKTATTHAKKYTCCETFVIETEAHEWNNGTCSECGYVCLHTSVAVTKKDGQGATCTVDGWKDYYQCACGKYFADEARTTPIADLEAWKVGDGKIVAEHTYGDLIPEESAVHTQTELKAGMEAHYKCSVCQGYFDENKNPTTEGALIIPAPQHSYGDWVKDNDKHWKACSCGLKADEHTHNYTDNADMTCNDCGFDRTVLHTCGNGTKQDGQGATCTVNGWKDYYKCSCGKIYTDAACTNEITSFEEWKNGDGKIAAGHSYGDLIAKIDATCSATGMQAHFECSVCHTLFDADKAVKTENELTIAIDTNAHTYGAWTSNGDGTHTRVCSLNAEHKENGNCVGGTATCTEKAVCATCNTAYGNTAAHSHGSEWKTDANEHWNECACGDKANKAAHTDSNNDGKCDVCDADVPVLPPVHNHDYGTAWESDANGHWNECACGDKANEAAHNDGDADGKCDVCDYDMPTTPGGDEPGTDTPGTDEPGTDTPNTPEAPTDKGCGGCGSSVGVGSVLAIVAVVGSALAIKKKED